MLHIGQEMEDSPMKTDQVNRWLVVGANVGVLLGLIFVAVELNQNSEQLRLQLIFETTQKIFENNQDLLGDNPAPTISKSITNPEALTFEEYLVASSYVLNLMNEMEDRYFVYHQAGLISDEDWKRHIDENISWCLGNRFAQEVWRTTKSAFESELANYVDQALTNVSETDTYNYWLEMRIAADSGKGNSK